MWRWPQINNEYTSVFFFVDSTTFKMRARKREPNETSVLIFDSTIPLAMLRCVQRVIVTSWQTTTPLTTKNSMPNTRIKAFTWSPNFSLSFQTTTSTRFHSSPYLLAMSHFYSSSTFIRFDCQQMTGTEPISTVQWPYNKKQNSVYVNRNRFWITWIWQCEMKHTPMFILCWMQISPLAWCF